jgi:hypothetical protein
VSGRYFDSENGAVNLCVEITNGIVSTGDEVCAGFAHSSTFVLRTGRRSIAVASRFGSGAVLFDLNWRV